MLRKTTTVASAGVLALTLGLGAGVPAQAATSAATAATCSLRLGSVTATGAHTSRTITATIPITVSAIRTTAGAFAPGQVQHTSTFVGSPLLDEEGRAGLTVLGGALYSSTYVADKQAKIDPNHPHRNSRIGGGWSNFRWIEESIHRPSDAGKPSRTTLYGQSTDGTTTRWIADGTGWRVTAGVGGLTTVKSMALIGRTYTNDTFIANTRAGKLIALRWPSTYQVGPTATTLRDNTWQVYEQLIATSCGASGTLLLGIDRDTQTGYLYALGHTAGTNTVIKKVGKVPMTFSDPQYFRWAPKYDVLNGG
jgi:hypothetical protein